MMRTCLQVKTNRNKLLAIDIVITHVSFCYVTECYLVLLNIHIFHMFMLGSDRLLGWKSMSKWYDNGSRKRGATSYFHWVIESSLKNKGKWTMKKS